MSLLLTAARLAMKAKMAKDVYDQVEGLLPPGVKAQIAETVAKTAEQGMETAAELIAQHAPSLGKKIAGRVTPKQPENDSLAALRDQMAELTKAMQQQAKTPVTAAPKKKAPARKKAAPKTGA